MSILKIENLNYELPDKVLYEEGELTLNRGEHMGLIGKNGAGKSTLIKIIIGEVLPDSGKITWQNNSQIGYLEQYINVDEKQTIREFLHTSFKDLFQLEKDIQSLYQKYAESYEDELLERAGKMQQRLEESDFYNVDQLVEKMAYGLGIIAIGMEKELKQLSGGQRSKVLLAKLLLEKPDVLLLDEPTNYLDDVHVVWLAEFLQEFSGSYMVISHDYHFLDQITNCIADIEFGHIQKYPGNLNKALQLKKVANENYVKKYNAQQEEIDKLEKFIRKYKAGSRSTMAKSREKQLNKMEKITAPEKTHLSSFYFPYKPILANYMIETNRLKIGYKEPLLPEINLIVERGEKVAINGFNGIGKSTLLKTLIGEIPSLSGNTMLAEGIVINYFSQDLAWENMNWTPFDYVREAYPRLNDKEIRTQLAKSGIHDDNVKKAMKFLSGGEQTKVKLCIMTMSTSNLLILDEPTNHLDTETKRELRKAVDEYEGTTLIVSHEVDFYENLATRIINVEELKEQLNQE